MDSRASSSPSRSPKRSIQETGIVTRDERPAKRHSPSPDVKHPLPCFSFPIVRSQDRDELASSDDEDCKSRRRSSSLRKVAHSRPQSRSTDSKPSVEVVEREPTPEENDIIIALANKADFSSDQDDEDKHYAQLRERIRKKKGERLAFEEARQQAKVTAAHEAIRVKEDKSSKKKRLAAIRRQQNRSVHDEELRKAKEAYDAYKKALDGVAAVRISDEQLDESLIRDGRSVTQHRLVDGKDESAKLPFVFRLSDEWISKVISALNVRSDAAVMAKSTEGVEISRKDLGRLLPPGEMLEGEEPWLNDEVINAWYANLCTRLNDKDGYIKGPNSTPRFVAYSTAWFKNATERGIQSIANWSRRKGIKNERLLKTERIFFPTNSGAHWTLLTISGKHRTIEYLDSMNKSGWKSKRYIGLAMEWLKMELGKKFIESEWEVLHTRSALQTNCNDCGVFACLNGLALVRDMPDPSVEFGSADIPLGRRMFIATLLNGGFTGDFDI